ncbi:MAG: protein-export chaperone SecB [Aquisalimonadaceae bacterium]
MAEEQSNGVKGQPQGDGPRQQFSIHKIYLKDSSFEVPGAPEIFRGEWKPQVNVDLGTETKRIDDNTFESVLRITVTAKLEDKTAYLCEVEQAGIFGIAGFEGETLDALLGSYCPANLFPYAREAISDLVGKGGFPQMLLGPVNFEALYMQKKQEAAKASGQPSTGQA